MIMMSKNKMMYGENKDKENPYDQTMSNSSQEDMGADDRVEKFKMDVERKAQMVREGKMSKSDFINNCLKELETMKEGADKGMPGLGATGIEIILSEEDELNE